MCLKIFDFVWMLVAPVSFYLLITIQSNFLHMQIFHTIVSHEPGMYLIGETFQNLHHQQSLVSRVCMLMDFN